MLSAVRDIRADATDRHEVDTSPRFGEVSVAALPVAVCTPKAYWRSRLSEFIDHCVETQLSCHGAEPKPASVPRNLDDSLKDQLRRCREIGFGTLELSFDELDTITRAGVLDATDSTTLRWWLDAEGLFGLSIHLSPSVSKLRAYLAPVPVASLAAAARASQCDSPLSLTPHMPFAVSPPVPQDAPVAAPVPESATTQLAPLSLDEPLAPRDHDLGPEAADAPLDDEDPLSDIGDLLVAKRASRSEAPPAVSSVPSNVSATARAPRQDLFDELHADLLAEDHEPSPIDGLLYGLASHTDAPAEAAAAPLAPSAAASDDTLGAHQLDAGSEVAGAGPVNPAEPTGEPPLEFAEATQPAQEEKAHLRLWRESLEHAEGSQSWDDLERLYLANYLPLVHAVESGEAGEVGRQATEEWAANFEQCYQQAFHQLARGAKRPTMVCDIPQLAFNLARELEAPRTRLILVDGMRFDVGQRVHDKLRLQLTPMCQSVARGVLWSALPANSAIQLELLARGPTALRSLSTETALDVEWVTHGAAARRLRPLRVGGVSLTKLDILEADFGEATWDRGTLERAAAEVATSVGRAIKHEAPGTLVMVFSDHGMLGGDTRAQAAPEQVLVPYDAWFVTE